MKSILKSIGELVAGAGFLFALYRGALIDLGEAVMSGFNLVVLVLLLTDQLSPINNALAEIQKWLGERLGFAPLHKIKPDGSHGSGD